MSKLISDFFISIIVKASPFFLKSAISFLHYFKQNAKPNADFSFIYDDYYKEVQRLVII